MGYLQEKKRALMNSAKGSRLPSEYQEVEWIGSNRNQYINVNCNPNENTEYIVDCSFNGTEGRFGVIGYANISRYYFGVVSGMWACSIFGNNTQYNHSIGVSDTDRHTFSISKNGFFIDEIYRYQAFNTLFNLGYSLYAFGLNESGTFGYKGSFTVYEIKVIENGETIREMIPCYRKLDEKIGMYDLVYGQFYTNQGTGNFTKGDDV